MAGRRLNHEGSLTQLPSGSWRAQITLQGRRIGKTFPRQSHARDWLAEMYRLKNQGYSYDAHRTTLTQFVDAWLQTRQASLRPNTLEQYTRTIRLYLTPTLGKYKLADLTPALIQTTYDKLAAQLAGAHLTTHPLRITHAVLHQVLDHAARLGILTRNPSDLVIIPRTIKSQPAEEQLNIWTESQVSAYLSSLTPQITRNIHLYHLAIATGMRRGELIGLQWDDIDWLKSTLHIQRQVIETPAGWRYQSPKTRAGHRTIQIGPGLLEALRLQLRLVDLTRQFAAHNWHENNLIFPNTHGNPQDGYSLSKEFTRLTARAGLPHIRFHDMRHTAASIMLMHGIPLIEVSKTLGHSKPSITLDVYAHYIPTDHARSAALMDQITATIPIDLTPLPVIPKTAG